MTDSSLLDKFPATRRDNLLRRYAVKWGFDPDQVEQVVQAGADQPCNSTIERYRMLRRSWQTMAAIT
ncbi:hypothetical protein [Amycolatopsis sp. cmx-4-54]|uniref:hypothetical protein n=1 Tax=Amycolatopsis sp. cmx-4-54 TaxID=2790936 RepID=UPI003978F79F